MITDLISYKDVKKAKKIRDDLQSSLKALQICLDTLKQYKRYVTIMESMSTLSTSYRVTELQLKRCQDFIKDHKDD